MDPVGFRVAVAPGRAVALCGFVAGGIALGTVSGLTPGLHANTFAFLLAGAVGTIPGPPAFVAAAMLAAGVVHTFLDVVPALALGVPDASMAHAALPGHRLVLAGQGREALRLSALGSGGAVLLAAPLAVPVTALMTDLYPHVREYLPILLAGVMALLVLTERSRSARVGAVASLAASGALGVATLDLPTSGLVDAGGTLAPLFTGLFGAPVLLDALAGDGVPEQAGPAVTSSPAAVAQFVLTGTVAGAAVGYVPGVSSAIAATAALLALPNAGARGFVVATSGVNTANTVFALFALVALGTPRTGVLVAIEETGAPLSLPVLLGSVAAGAAAGVALVPRLGDWYLRTVGDLDYARLCVGVLAGLAVLLAALTGPIGVGVFGAATAVGLVPARFGARRANLMGVLLCPLALQM